MAIPWFFSIFIKCIIKIILKKEEDYSQKYSLLISIENKPDLTNKRIIFLHFYQFVINICKEKQK